MFDGVDQTPPGGMLGNGNPLGFICAGNTYVPLRWLAQQLGRAVQWDGSTHTVSVSSSGASQNGAEFHVSQVQTGAAGTTVAVQVYNTTGRTSYVSFTVHFEDGFGHVLSSIPGPQTGADSFGKAEIGAGQTQTMRVTSAKDLSGYVSIAVAPWADAVRWRARRCQADGTTKGRPELGRDRYPKRLPWAPAEARPSCATQGARRVGGRGET